MKAALMGFDSCVVAAQKACLRGGRSHYNTGEGLLADSESSLVPVPPSLVNRNNPFPFWRNFLMAQVLTSAPGGLAVSERVEERLRNGELTQAQVDDFRDFLAEVDHDLLNHCIIKNNAYTRWFQKGEAIDQELKHFVKQFSVFSNQFLVAQLLKVINAPSLEQMRAGKEILMNELGVVYRKPNPLTPTPLPPGERGRGEGAA